MFSRRQFLGCCAASSVGLASPALVRGDEEQPKKHAPLLNPAARKATAAGLKHLRAGQNKNGSFGAGAYKGNVGVTSLCGLAMLSAGGRADGAIDSAIDFVLGEEDPRKPGYLHNPAASPHGPMYNHGFAVWFLAAAHGKVTDKKRAKKLDETLKRAVALTLASQNAQKGWRYLPTSADSDLTVTACQLCSLRAARDAGVGVPRAALDGGAGYVKKCQERTGGFRYMSIGGTGNWARTGAALLALYSAGVTRGREVERGLAFLLKNRPAAKARPDFHYYYGHFHATLATWSAGGEPRKKWYEATRDELITLQGKEGGWKDPIGAHYATALALIALQAPNGVLSPVF
jgi:hypothetical protein